MSEISSFEEFSRELDIINKYIISLKKIETGIFTGTLTMRSQRIQNLYDELIELGLLLNSMKQQIQRPSEEDNN